jgi:hypothetical protein
MSFSMNTRVGPASRNRPTALFDAMDPLRPF